MHDRALPSRLRWRPLTLLLGASLTLSIGCSTDDPLGWRVLLEICTTEDVDGSSEIYTARDANGEATRFVVSPTQTIQDAGSLVFDAKGQLLGHQTGGEFPYEDEALAAEERQRVAELMDGAEISADPVRTCW